MLSLCWPQKIFKEIILAEFTYYKDFPFLECHQQNFMVFPET